MVQLTCQTACREMDVDVCCRLMKPLVDSDHTLLPARFCLLLICGHISTKATCPVQLTLDNNRRLLFHPELSMQLPFQQNVQHPSEHWLQIRGVLLSVAAQGTQGSLLQKTQKRSISSTSVVLLGARRSVPADTTCNMRARRSLSS